MIEITKEDLAEITRYHKGLREQNKQLIEEREKMIHALKRINKTSTLTRAKVLAGEHIDYEEITPFTLSDSCNS